MTDELDALAAAVNDAETVVALTGAGVSTASGIPDFRSDGGLWEKFDPMDFQYSNFKSNPGDFWELRARLRDELLGEEPEPNAAHEAMATMEREGDLDAVITQNIDGLHQAAGTETCIELHGNARQVKCEGCGERSPAEPAQERADAGELPPRCQECDAILKPDVVLFGEPLPQDEISAARQYSRQADVYLAIGSSLTIDPAASLPDLARRAGATLAIINLEDTSLSDTAEFDIRANVAEALPTLVENL